MPVDVMQVEGDAGDIRVPGSAVACLTAPLRLKDDMAKFSYIIIQTRLHEVLRLSPQLDHREARTLQVMVLSFSFYILDI